MPEKHEYHSEHTKRRLRLGTILDTLTGRRSEGTTPPRDSDDEIGARLKARRRQEFDQRPTGPGLKGYDVELGLFRYPTDMTELMSRGLTFFSTFREIIGRYRQDGKDIQGQFHDDSEKHPFESLMFSSAAQSRPTARLSEWLEANVPQNGYFTPEMILKAIDSDPSISVTHEIGDIESWTFSNKENEQLTLSRAADGNRPAVRTQPYLAVRYSPEYDFDTEEVVTEPKLSLTGYDEQRSNALKGGLGNTIKAALGVVPVRLDQKIEFHVVDARPVPYLASADGSFESITAQARVVADLPQAQ